MDWKELSLREKIGQTVVSPVSPEEMNNVDMYIKKYGGVKEFLQRYPIGGLYKGGAIVGGDPEIVSRFIHMTNDFDICSKVPIIVCADTCAPERAYYMNLGATYNEELAYQFGKVSAKQLMDMGIDWVFAPDVDISVNPRNPIVNVRSLGGYPKLLIDLFTQMLRGMHEEGIASCLKHFPGSMFTDIDPHLAQCDANVDEEQWFQTVGIIYQELIRNGAEAIMTGHDTLKCFQTPNEEGEYDPCTLSYELTTGLLKKRLGFEGVVITDALTMGGFANPFGSCESEIKSFVCGSDMLLWPKIEYIDILEQKILSCEISEERLNDAVSRIWHLKEKKGLFKEERKGRTTAKNDTVVKAHNEQAEAVYQKIADDSMTIMANKKNMIPIDKNKIKKVLVVAVTPDDISFEQLRALQYEFEARNIETELVRDLSFYDVEKKQKEVDFIIYAISRIPGRPQGTMDVYGDNALSVWAANISDPNRTIIASFGTPYLYTQLFLKSTTYINAYTYTKFACKAFVKAILGEIPFKGKSPVEL